MSAVRPTLPPRELTADEKAFKVMTGQLIDECGGNGAVAALLGVSKALVSKWCVLRIPDAERSPCFIPHMHMMTLERRCGVGVISRWMTDHAETGPNAPIEKLSLQHLAQMATEGGEAKAALVSALADGKIDAGDRESLRSELMDVIALYTRLLRAVDQP